LKVLSSLPAGVGDQRHTLTEEEMREMISAAQRACASGKS
jgi:hypothetical protein